MEQCCQVPVGQIETNHKHDYESITPAAEVTRVESNSGGFDCNICLDSVQDPVVTLCGHLYCWPCIYTWLHSMETTLHDHPDQHPKCPVCKTDVSENTLIPLYGRSRTDKPSDNKATQLGSVIPHRPNRVPGVHQLIETPSSIPHSHHTPQLHNRHGYLGQEEGHSDYSLGGYTRSHAFGFAGTTTFYPVIGMFGEMIYARLFRNPETTLYTNLNTYGGASVGRHTVQAERSLSRVSFFLFCCTILCLFLF